MSEWQPIATAPKDGTRILMADAEEIETGSWVEELESYGRVLYPAGWEDERYDAAHRFESTGNQPTHWMPLPEPPKDAANV